MKLSNAMKLVAGAALACASPMSFATAQQTPETVELIPGKTCAPVAVIQASLRAEGQVKIIEGFGAVPARPREIFTSNVQRTLGYNISFGTAVNGDEGIGCVGAKYTDIRLNSNPNFARPSWAYIAPDDSNYNRFLSTQETRVNAQVLMGATDILRDENGQERRGGLLTVVRGFGNPNVNNQGVLVIASTSNGNYGINADLVKIEPNKTNFRQLAMAQDNDRPAVALAALSPR